MCIDALRWVEPVTPKWCDAPATHSEMRANDRANDANADDMR
jgi:hypothetical protein